MNPMFHVLGAAALLSSAVAAQAQVQITEWMYNGNGKTGEYVEFTNLGSSAVDFSGWSFDDSSRTVGSFSLSGLGIVAAGQSVVMTEASAADFHAAWGQSAAVKVVGGNTHNLGRGDEINLYDAAGQLVDRLTYGDVAIPGTLRAQNFSGNPGSLADLVPQAVTAGWVLAAEGDAFGSYASSLGDVGNPGLFTLAVPEPSTYALLLAGLGLVGAVARRRQA
ncbi:MAG: lamin tail domain-containing protein [Burkholderiaceae bacterium]|nr:lamin tail domain-containing protein [Burkholderiaceae bacterium]